MMKHHPSKSAQKTLLFLIWAIALNLNLAGCGSGASSSTNVSISGVAQLGRIEEAEVKIFDLEGNLLGSGETDANGQYNIQIPQTDSPCYVEVSGKPDGSTTYVDEATQEVVVVGDNDAIGVLLKDASQSQLDIPVTQFTTEAYEAMKVEFGTEFSSLTPQNADTAWENALKQVAELHGIPDHETLLQLPSNPLDVGGEQNAAALHLAQYSKYLAQNNIPPSEAFAATRAIATSLADDGKLEAGDMAGDSAKYAVLALNFDNATTGFQAAATAFVNSPECPADMKAKYLAGSITVGVPDMTPQDYIGLAHDYISTVSAGGIDPCAPGTYNVTACPMPGNESFDPAKYDEWKITDGGGYSEASGYVGTGESSYTGGSNMGTYQPLYFIVTGSGDSRMASITNGLTGSAPTGSIGVNWLVKRYNSSTYQFTEIASGMTASASFAISVASANSGEMLMLEAFVLIDGGTAQPVFANFMK